MLVFLALIGHWMDPSRYPTVPLWLAARRMSLRHEAQFVPSNLSFSMNVGVDSVDDIIIFVWWFQLRLEQGADNLINVVAQTLPTMVHDYIQYLINVVAIRIMSTSWRNGFSWKVLTSDITHNGTQLRSEVTMCWIYAYCSPWLQGLPLSKCLTFHFYPMFHQVGS